MTIEERETQSVRAERGSLKRRAAYSLAASAAACARASEANAVVVYSGLQDISIAQFNSLPLNIDGDAYGDILLKNYVFGGGNYQGATVSFFPGKPVGFGAAFPFYISALTAGTMIDAAALGPSFYGSMAYGAANPQAQFNNVSSAYIGLAFPIAAVNHFGWVRVDVSNATGTFVVKDWAYETDPGIGIRAGDGLVPEPGTLGMLAAGAAGVLAMRRRRKAV